MPAKTAIIDNFAFPEKYQNVQLSIAGILPAFRAGIYWPRRLTRRRHFRRRSSPPPRKVVGDIKIALMLSAIYWLLFQIFKELSCSEIFRRRIAAKNVHDHPGKRSRRFGQMILKVWSNDPERLTKPSRTFFRMITVVRRKHLVLKEETVA